MIQVFTARISYSGADKLDVSRKSGNETGLVFAPSWSLLGPYLALRKIGPITEQEWQRYAEAYTQEMRASYRRNRTVWEALLDGDAVLSAAWNSDGDTETYPESKTITLCCYCSLVNRCHRTILATILGKLGAAVMGERA